MLDSATVTSARYVPVPARTQTNFCCRYVRLSPTPTAPPALHRVSSESIEIVSRRRRLSIFETTRASHSSPTKASTSAGSSPRLKPSSSASSVEKCRVVPLTESVSVGTSTVSAQVPEQLPLAAAVAGREHDSLDGVLLEARHVRVDAPCDLHRLEEAQAARLERVDLRPRPDGRFAELRRVLRRVSSRTRIRVGFESAPRGTDTVRPPSLLVTVCAGGDGFAIASGVGPATTDAEPRSKTMRAARLARVI